MKQNKKKVKEIYNNQQISPVEITQDREKIKVEKGQSIKQEDSSLQNAHPLNLKIKTHEKNVIRNEDKNSENIDVINEKKQNEVLEKKNILDGTKSIANEKELKKEKNHNFISNKIFYEANIMNMNLQKNKLTLKGNSKINYEDNLLLAHKIDMNLQKKEIFATFLKKKGIHASKKVQLKFLNKNYYATDLRINLKSEKARISNLFTVINSILFRAKLFKKISNDEFFVYGSSVTTCNLPNPHYELYAEKGKISNNKRILTSPIFLRFEKVKTIGFFLGFFDWPDERQGVLFPKYGGNSNKGIYVENIGYYWNWKDLLDFLVKMNLFTGGEFQLGMESFYKKRYLMEGSIIYNNTFGLLSTNQNYRSWNFKWEHSTIENINRTNFIFINLNLKNTINSFSYPNEESDYQGTNDEYKESYKSINESSIRYMNKLNFIPFYRFHSKIAYIESTSKHVKMLDIIVPSIVIASCKIYPFRYIDDKLLSFLNIEHSAEFKNAINLEGYNFSIFNTNDWGSLFERQKYGIENIINLSADWNIKYLTVNPYFKNKNYYLFRLENKNKNIWDYDTGLIVKTNLYGNYLFSKNRSILAIRHQIVPSIILNYNPDSSKTWKNQNSNKKFIFFIPNREKALSLDVIINNIFSYKDREKKQKQIFIESLSLKSGYNFFKSDKPVKNIEFYEKLLFFGDSLIFELTQIFNPYCNDLRIKNRSEDYVQKLYITKDKILGRIEEASIKISTKFSMNKELTQADKKTEYSKFYLEYSNKYVDFTIPLTLGLNYLYKYISPIPYEKKVSSVLSTDISLSLSRNWKISIETGYDFQKKQIAREQTYIKVTRDLHCWDMAFKCYPNAKDQLFDFSIGVKPSLLDGIKHSRKSRSYKNLF